MHTYQVFIIWSMVATLGCRLLVTALPRLDYIRVIDKTVLIDSPDGGRDDDDFFPWSSYGLPHYQFDTDLDAVSDEQVNTGTEVSDDTGLEAVKVPATVYPHDTTPTATLRDNVANSQSNIVPPCTVTGLTTLAHQRRNALPNPAEDMEAIPSSLKAQEASAPPVETSSLPIALPCAGLSSCPKGYKTYIMMGLCSCRRPPDVED